MYFDLTDEQKQFADNVTRLFASGIDAAQLTKGANIIDPLRAKLDDQLAELGAAAVLVSEADGGIGMDLLTLTVLAELIGEHGAPTMILNTALAAWAVARSGHAALKALWLERLISGEAKAAFALCEGDGRWAPDEISACADDGEIVRFNVADGAHADLIIAPLADGVAFIEAGSAGIERASGDALDMTRSTVTVRFAPVSATIVTSFPRERLFDALLIFCAAAAAGSGRRALHMATDYAKAREQFGRPIGSFQGLKHQLADMSVDMEPARFLVWRAAHAWDQQAENASREAALAKAHATDVAVKTARAAVEAHGGIGYTWEYPLHIFLKRAMHDRMMLGMPARLRQRVAALTPAAQRS